MKSKSALAIAVAAGTLAILVAASAPAQPQPQPQLLTTPLFPLKVGTRWTYAVTTGNDLPGKKEAKKTVTIEVEREEPYLRKKKNAENKDVEIKNTGFILKAVGGAKEQRDHVVVLEDGVYKVFVADTQMSPPLCAIKFGKGEPWRADSKSGNTTVKGTYTLKATSVKVPYRNFDDAKKTFLVSFTNNIIGIDRVEVDCWYVIDIGMVKQRVLEKGHEIVLELEKFEPAK